MKLLKFMRGGAEERLNTNGNFSFTNHSVTCNRTQGS